MATTSGMNHLGLSVANLQDTAGFFVGCLGWEESGRDNSYPRTAVSDGNVRLTLWQVDHHLAVEPFHRRKNIGLHHLALSVQDEQSLDTLAKRIANWPGVEIR